MAIGNSCRFRAEQLPQEPSGLSIPDIQSCFSAKFSLQFLDMLCSFHPENKNRTFLCARNVSLFAELFLLAHAYVHLPVVSDLKLTTCARGSGVSDNINTNTPIKNTKYTVCLKVACPFQNVTNFQMPWFEISLQWRHNGRDGVSNHRRFDCLLNRLFRRISKKRSKFRITGLCEGNSPVTSEFPSQRASNAGNVSIWWRHHDSDMWQIENLMKA